MSSVLPLPLIMSQGTHLRLFVNLKQLIHVVYRVYLLFVQQENDLLLRLHVKMKAKVSGTMQPLYLVEIKIEKKSTGETATETAVFTSIYDHTCAPRTSSWYNTFSMVEVEKFT